MRIFHCFSKVRVISGGPRVKKCFSSRVSPCSSGAAETLTFFASQRSLDGALFHHPFNCDSSTARCVLRFFVFSQSAALNCGKRKRGSHVRPVVMIKTEDGIVNPNSALTEENLPDPRRPTTGRRTPRPTVNWGEWLVPSTKVSNCA